MDCMGITHVSPYDDLHETELSHTLFLLTFLTGVLNLAYNSWRQTGKKMSLNGPTQYSFSSKSFLKSFTLHEDPKVVTIVIQFSMMYNIDTATLHCTQYCRKQSQQSLGGFFPQKNSIIHRTVHSSFSFFQTVFHFHIRKKLSLCISTTVILVSVKFEKKASVTQSVSLLRLSLFCLFHYGANS